MVGGLRPDIAKATPVASVVLPDMIGDLIIRFFLRAMALFDRRADVRWLSSVARNCRRNGRLGG
jgi:hypothetical protein